MDTDHDPGLLGYDLALYVSMTILVSNYVLYICLLYSLIPCSQPSLSSRTRESVQVMHFNIIHKVIFRTRTCSVSGRGGWYQNYLSLGMHLFSSYLRKYFFFKSFMLAKITLRSQTLLRSFSILPL